MVQVSYSTYGFAGVNFAPTFEQIANIGFECVEFACDRHGVEDRPLEIAADVRRALEQQHLTATTVHAPARRNVLGAPDNEWRTQAIAVLADALRLTGEIGARGLVIHGIPNPMFLPQDQDMRSFYNGFPRDAHPMAILSSVVSALSTFYQDSLNPGDPEQVEISVQRLMAKLPTIAAFSYKKSIGQPFHYPRNDLAYCENFLQMMFAVPTEPYEIDPDFVEALNLLLIVHADHEQNCSTSTVRMVGSSNANIFASIAAGIGALWGPLHGGANQACVEMLESILADGGDVDKYVDMAKDKDNPFRLMGFGHRVYKNHDPRAKLIRVTCDRLLAKMERNDPIFDIAKKLEEVALQDPYFIEKKLYPNVDFYSGVIYRAIGIPIQMFTVLFAMGRLPGWIAHWKEMHASPSKRICRPRQVYMGPTERQFVPLDQR